jgi:hypothetical protein
MEFSTEQPCWTTRHKRASRLTTLLQEYQLGLPYLSFTAPAFADHLSPLASSEGWVTFRFPTRWFHVQTQASSCYQRRALDPTLELHGTVGVGSVSLVLFVFRVEVPRRFWTDLIPSGSPTFSGDPDVPYSGRRSPALAFASLFNWLLERRTTEVPVYVPPDLARLRSGQESQIRKCRLPHFSGSVLTAWSFSSFLHFCIGAFIRPNSP